MIAHALDQHADAGGTEGSHITWTPDEVRAALAGFPESDVADVLARWRIDPEGSFGERRADDLRAILEAERFER